MNKRKLKDALYEQVARIGKTLSSPKRLEMLELLAQGEKTVETLAAELSVDIKLASAHLRALREARLIAGRRAGKNVFYRLSGPEVAGLWVILRQVAETNLLELRHVLAGMTANPQRLAPVGGRKLLDRARRGEVILIDVRPRAEYEAGHLPHARSMPIDEIRRRIAELPANKDIVAYCRGPFCMFSEEATALLTARGYRATKLLDGVSEWRAAGLPIETALAS